MLWDLTHAQVRTTSVLKSFDVIFLSSVVGVYSSEVRGPIFVFYGLSSGVSQVLFSSCGRYLYSGERKVTT